MVTAQTLAEARQEVLAAYGMDDDSSVDLKRRDDVLASCLALLNGEWPGRVSGVVDALLGLPEDGRSSTVAHFKALAHLSPKRRPVILTLTTPGE